MNKMRRNIKNCKIKSTEKWQSGFEILKVIGAISKQMQYKEPENPNMAASLVKMDRLYNELKLRFEDNLNRIKDVNFAYGSSYEKKSSLRDNPESLEFQQEFLGDVDAQDINEQHQFVNERQQNIVELDKALSSIHNMGQKIYEITKEDDIKINTILKHQKEHKDNLDDRINTDIYRTKELNDNTCKKLLCFGIMAVLLGLTVILLCI